MTTPSKVKKIAETLKKKGASEVKLIKTSDIVVDDRVRLKCQIPVCESYGRNLMCPPYAPSVSDFRAALENFDKGLLIQVTVPLDRKPIGKAKAIFDPARVLHEIVNMGERLCFEAGYRFATGLIGGHCRLCKECVAVHFESHCRHPFRARPSMEAMGIDVVATAENAKLPVSPFPVQDRVTWTGLILL